MAIPLKIQKILKEKEKRIASHDFADWGSLVFSLKKNILLHQRNLTKQDLLEIKQKVSYYQEKLDKKSNFLKNYQNLLFR